MRIFGTWAVVAVLAAGCTGEGAGKGGGAGADGGDAADLDADGYPAGLDCDDADAAVHPGADEVCDGADNDCDGAVDAADVDAIDTVEVWADGDGDGAGAGDAVVACAAGDGQVENGDDCDDGDATVGPDAPEACDGQDNDCDGGVDEDGAPGAPAWFYDADGDGVGGPVVVQACAAPAGAVAEGGDCDDGDGLSFPGADEVCDGQDNDCDGEADEADALDARSWYRDGDGDGFGEPGTLVLACEAPAEHVADSTDCDDTDFRTNPLALEVCGGADEDCDGAVDEADAVDAPAWYADADGDTWGDPAVSTRACVAPAGHVADARDCDDARSAVSPAADERCNGRDDDCDGTADEATAVDALDWFTDADGDGAGGSSTVRACAAPTGAVASGGDCDDGDVAVGPGADERCNGQDDDCDGSTDEDGAVDAPDWYADTDGDTYGDDALTERACAAPLGHVASGGDCDDGDPAVNPGVAVDTCDGVDEDCDGTFDEDGLLGDDAFCPAGSCAEVLAARPGAPSGAYWLDPDTSGAFETYCDMTTAGGGWTLLGVFTNGDGSSAWSPTSANWVNAAALGDPTSPSTNADAKSDAWSSLAVDELLIVQWPGTIQVQSVSSCLPGWTMQTLFARNSSNGSNCAYACGTVSRGAAWSQSQTDSTLRFRCMDVNGGTTTAAGYTISGDDNSFITTMQNGPYIDYNFGLGAGYVGSFVDYDASTDDYGNPSVSTQQVLYGR